MPASPGSVFSPFEIMCEKARSLNSSNIWHTVDSIGSHPPLVDRSGSSPTTENGKLNVNLKYQAN